MYKSGENYDTSDGNRTVLTVEGTYTSGDREGITVSHEIDFGTMQIKRNYLYKVRIALEDPAGDTYGKVTHAINVKDWTSGVILAWAGDENLYNNLAAANFTVTGTIEKQWDADGDNLERHIISPFNAEKSATFYVESTSTKSGLSLTCPAMAQSATEGGYQCTITPQDNVYNENGQFTQKWAVTVRESALLYGNILTFTLQNALNSALSASFEVIGAPFASSTDIQAGDVYYSNGLWSRPADRDECAELSTPVGIIAPVAAYESGDGDVMLGTEYCAKLYSKIAVGDIFYAAGFWSCGYSAAGGATTINACKDISTPIGLVFSTSTTTFDQSLGYSHGFVVALEDYEDSNTSAFSVDGNIMTEYGITQSGNFDNKATGTELSSPAEIDLNGLQNTLKFAAKVTSKAISDCSLSDLSTATAYPAVMKAVNYVTQHPSYTTPALASGWYLPSIGQMYLWAYYFGGRTNVPSFRASYNDVCWSSKGSETWTNMNTYFSSQLGSIGYTRWGWDASDRQSYWSSTVGKYTKASPFEMLNVGNTFYLNGFDPQNYPSRVRPVFSF